MLAGGLTTFLWSQMGFSKYVYEMLPGFLLAFTMFGIIQGIKTLKPKA
jgi:hypothetical protein